MKKPTPRIRFNTTQQITQRRPSFTRSAIFALCVMFTCACCQAQRNLKDIPIPDPELEKATFILPEGFEVNLYAADPAIAKPIQMNFDEMGRLWVASSETYPHIEPGAAQKDRVLVIQDHDHDGVADETTVFATGLLIPTGVAPGDGGAYVANSTELLHFQDIDGDLVADSKRVVLSGFGTEDTHHILHTLRWGPDGSLYFNQSIYIHSHIETPWGVRRLNAGGIWQFRPETLQMGILMRGLVNSWGHDFDRFGQSFATDGAGGDGINYIIPGASYVTAANASRVLRGLNPGSPKHCGLEIVETAALPDDWQGNAITNDFRGHRVCRFRLVDDRAGYQSFEQEEVIKSNHVAFRPIDVKVGPDGAIYIADWYNPIIQHGEVDFRDARRDQTHGRIWRVTWKGAPDRAAAVNFDDLANSEVLAHLRSTEKFARDQAKQQVRARGASIQEDLDEWAKSLPNDDATEQLKLEALWCYQCLRSQNLALLNELLSAKDGKVRAAAVRVLTAWKFDFPESAQRLVELTSDEHPRVRLEAIRGLTYSALEDSRRQIATAKGQQNVMDELQSIDRIQAVLQTSSLPRDRFLDYAIWLSVNELKEQWLPAFQTGNFPLSNDVEQLLTAFSAIGQGAPVDRLIELASAPETQREQTSQIASIVGQSGNATQVVQFLNLLSKQPNADLMRVLTSKLMGRKNFRAPAASTAIEEMLKASTGSMNFDCLRAAGALKIPNAVNLLSATATTETAESASRAAALEGLAAHGGDGAVNALEEIARNDGLNSRIRVQACAKLASYRADRASRVLVALLPVFDDPVGPEEVVQNLVARRDGAAALAAVLSDQEIDTAVARRILQSVRASGQSFVELESIVKRNGNVRGRKDMSKEDRERILTMASQLKTADAGEAVFRMKALNCLNCHAIGGAGGKVGPDMISLGGSAQPDYLLDSLLKPNAKVKENYNTSVVFTNDGLVHSGVKVRQSKQQIVLRTADGKLKSIRQSEIEEIEDGRSLMPEGLVDELTDEQIAALVRFMSELGRTADFTISRQPMARSWKVMNATKDAAFRLRRTSYAMAATDDQAFLWTDRFSKVDGTLPITEVPVVAVKNRSAAGNRGVGFARCELITETAGRVVLQLNDPTGLELRNGEKPVEVRSVMKLDLKPGTHRLTFAIDSQERTTPLSLKLVTDETTAVAKFNDSGDAF